MSQEESNSVETPHLDKINAKLEGGDKDLSGFSNEELFLGAKEAFNLTAHDLSKTAEFLFSLELQLMLLGGLLGELEARGIVGSGEGATAKPKQPANSPLD